MASKIWRRKAAGIRGLSTPDDVSTRIEAVPLSPLGNGSCTCMTLRAGEERPRWQSGQSDCAAARSARLTGGGKAGGGAALMFANIAAGLERALATTLAAPGVCCMSAVYSLMKDSCLCCLAVHG
jgi:hypothetical protein